MSKHISRRTVLQGAAAVGGAAALGALSAPSHAADPALTYDAVIIGAGLSGLRAAEYLVSKGKSVVVVEARARAGGRVHSITTPTGVTVDAGAEFVGPTQDHMLAATARYGVQLQNTYNSGWSVFYRDGWRNYFLASVGFPLDFGAAELAAAIVELEIVMKDFPVGEPWRHPKAAEWDSITWQDWCNRRSLSISSARLLLELTATTPLSIRPHEISALFMLNYIAAAGNPTKKGSALRLIGVKDGAQEKFFAGGAAQVPLRMAAALGGRVVYNAPVSTVNQNNGLVEVVTAQGTFKGKRCIVAMSPAITNRITFNPGLPADRVALQNATKMGAIGKFFAVYNRPWWRDRWLSGQSIGNGGPVDVTFESYGEGKHILMGFVSADEMRRLDGTPKEDVMEECLDSMVELFGNQVRTALVDQDFFGWDNEAWSWGGPTGVNGANVLSQYGPALRRPAGLIHWAGTETAIYWCGYMDGAVSAGERAAREVEALV